jgi:hypothetical protein
MAVDVVVVNYHTPDLLIDFVTSYIESSWYGCTLTIVDVESTEYSVRGTWDAYITAADNIGYGRACNEGAACGENEVILLANADTYLTAGLRECHDALLEHDDWGVLGPAQINEEQRITAGGIIGPDARPSQRGWMQPDGGQYRFIDPDVVSVSGALYFIKRSLWQELTACPLYQDVSPGATGAFLETPHYYEEMWCSYHARAHGYRCVYYGAVRMLHIWHAASPVGGRADQQMPVSLERYREACRYHSIICE